MIEYSNGKSVFSKYPSINLIRTKNAFSPRLISALLILTSATLSHATQIEVFPKDLMVFTESEYQMVSDTFRVYPDGREITPRAAQIQSEERTQNILTQITRHTARSYCAQQKCGDQPCIDFQDFNLEIRFVENKVHQKRWIVNPELSQIAIFPRLEIFDPERSRPQEGFFLKNVVCTDQIVNPDFAQMSSTSDGIVVLKDAADFIAPIPPLSQDDPDWCYQLIDQVVSTVSSEGADWFDISKGLLQGAGTTVCESYRSLKDTLRYCPKEALQSCIYRGLSIISFGASSYATEQAKKLSDIMRVKIASRGQTEPQDYRIERLVKKFEEDRYKFDAKDQKNIDTLIASIPARQVYDHQGELPGMLDRFEAILSLPKKPQMFSAEIEGRELKEKLTSLQVSSEFVERAYRTAALMTVAVHHNVFIPLRPIYIQGHPGVGKTFFAEVMARTLKIPFCMIKFKKAESAVAELLGDKNAWGGPGHSGPTAGLLAECFMDQKDADGNPITDKVNNPLIFFDELDRVLNSSTAGPLRAQLLGLFNNTENSRKIEATGLNNVKIDFSRSPIFIAANGVIQPEGMAPAPTSENSAPGGEEKKVDTQVFDSAFKSRLDVIEMPKVTREQKVNIAETNRVRIMDLLGLERLDDDIQKTHDEILQRDNEPGVRVLTSVVFENLAIQAARNLGWDLKPLDLDSVYRDAKADEKVSQAIEKELDIKASESAKD